MHIAPFRVNFSDPTLLALDRLQELVDQPHLDVITLPPNGTEQWIWLILTAPDKIPSNAGRIFFPAAHPMHLRRFFFFSHSLPTYNVLSQLHSFLMGFDTLSDMMGVSINVQMAMTLPFSAKVPKTGIPIRKSATPATASCFLRTGSTVQTPTSTAETHHVVMSFCCRRRDM